MIVSVPSAEASNEVARDMVEKEVFGDVQADEPHVVEDETDVGFSKESKSLTFERLPILGALASSSIIFSAEIGSEVLFGACFVGSS